MSKILVLIARYSLLPYSPQSSSSSGAGLELQRVESDDLEFGAVVRDEQFTELEGFGIDFDGAVGRFKGLEHGVSFRIEVRSEAVDRRSLGVLARKAPVFSVELEDRTFCEGFTEKGGWGLEAEYLITARYCSGSQIKRNRVTIFQRDRHRVRNERRNPQIEQVAVVDAGKRFGDHRADTQNF